MILTHMTPAFIILSRGRYCIQENEALRVLLSDLCLRVARAPADSGYLGPGPGLYGGEGDLLITTQAEQSVRGETSRENCEEVRGRPEIMH